MVISLENLAYGHSLSERAINVCKENDFLSLDSLLQYYRGSGVFTDLRRVGPRTNQELVSICKFYLDSEFLELPLDSLVIKEGFSRLFLKLIVQYEMRSIHDIYSYCIQYPNLSAELFRFKLKYEYLNSDHKMETKKEKVHNSIIYLLSNLVNLDSEDISIRAKKVLLKVYNEIRTNPNLIFNYLDHGSIINIPGVGRKTESEVLLLLSNLVNESQKYEDDLNKEDYKYLMFCSYLNYDLDDFKRCVRFTNRNGNIQILLVSMLEYHFNSKLRDVENTVLYECFVYEEGYISTTYQSIASFYGLSRERVRQIRVSLLSKIKREVIVLKKLAKELGLNIDFHLDQLFYLFNLDELVSITNSKLPDSIIYYILDIWNDDYTLVICNERKFQFKYLVTNELYEGILFTKLFYDISVVIDEKGRGEFRYSIQDYILKAHLLDNLQIECIHEVLHEEFGFKGTGDTISFVSKKKTYLYEQIYDILLGHGKPLNVNELYEVLMERDGSSDRSVNSIRGVIRAHPDLFILTGSSEYGLRKWENAGIQLGGTIKQLIINYLDLASEPKHVYEIYKHLLSYRETNLRSIYSNMKLDPHNNFVFFVGGFVGLVRKSYDRSRIRFNNVSNKWKLYMRRKYMVNGRSSMTLEKLCVDLSRELHVEPVQIESLIMESVEKGDFVLASDGIIYEKSGNVQSGTIDLDEENVRHINDLIKNGDYVKALELCLKCGRVDGSQPRFESCSDYVEKIRSKYLL